MLPLRSESESVCCGLTLTWPAKTAVETWKSTNQNYSFICSLIFLWQEREYFIRLPYYLFASNPTHSLFSFDAWESQGRVACSHIVFPCSIETSTFSLSPYTLILSSLTRHPPIFLLHFLVKLAHFKAWGLTGMQTKSSHSSSGWN